MMEFLWFGGGALAATVIWYFILRNNKKKFAEWMDMTEIYFMNAIGQIDGISGDIASQIEDVFNNFRKGK